MPGRTILDEKLILLLLGETGKTTLEKMQRGSMEHALVPWPTEFSKMSISDKHVQDTSSQVVRPKVRAKCAKPKRPNSRLLCTFSSSDEEDDALRRAVSPLSRRLTEPVNNKIEHESPPEEYRRQFSDEGHFDSEIWSSPILQTERLGSKSNKPKIYGKRNHAFKSSSFRSLARLGSKSDKNVSKDINKTYTVRSNKFSPTTSGTNNLDLEVRSPDLFEYDNEPEGDEVLLLGEEKVKSVYYTDDASSSDISENELDSLARAAGAKKSSPRRKRFSDPLPSSPDVAGFEQRRICGKRRSDFSTFVIQSADNQSQYHSSSKEMGGDPSNIGMFDYRKTKRCKLGSDNKVSGESVFINPNHTLAATSSSSNVCTTSRTVGDSKKVKSILNKKKRHSGSDKCRAGYSSVDLALSSTQPTSFTSPRSNFFPIIDLSESTGNQSALATGRAKKRPTSTASRPVTGNNGGVSADSPIDISSDSSLLQVHTPSGTSGAARVSTLSTPTRSLRRSVSEDLSSATFVTPGSSLARARSSAQLEEDEAFARRLQEELFNEAALHYAQTAATPPVANASRPQSSNSVIEKIARLSPYEWQVHQAIQEGRDIPATPAGARHRDLSDILDMEILQYIEHHPSTTQRDCQEEIRRGRSFSRRIENPDGSVSIADRTRQSRQSLRSHRRRGRDEMDELLVSWADGDNADAFLAGFNSRVERIRHNIVNGTRGPRETLLGPIYATSPGGMGYEELLALGDTIGAVTTGLKTEQIRRLPTRRFRNTAAETSAGPGRPVECSVCCCDYEEGDELRILTCFHEFHAHCIDQWLAMKASCPVCRATVEVNGRNV